MSKYCIIFTLLVACSKPAAESASKPAEAIPTSGAAAPTAAPTPASAVKSEYAPGEFFSLIESMARLDAMERFVDGVTIVGTVIETTDEAQGEFHAILDAGGGRTLAVTFGDFGKAARAAKLSKGMPLRASKCHFTAPQDKRMTVTLCDLEAK